MVGQKTNGGSDERVVLFVKMKEGEVLGEGILGEIKLRVRNTCVSHLRLSNGTDAVNVDVLRDTFQKGSYKSPTFPFVPPLPLLLLLTQLFHSTLSTARKSKYQLRNC